MSGTNPGKRPLNNLSFFELFSSMINKFYFYFFSDRNPWSIYAIRQTDRQFETA
jgi:hypothetical protein